MRRLKRKIGSVLQPKPPVAEDMEQFKSASTFEEADDIDHPTPNGEPQRAASRICPIDGEQCYIATCLIGGCDDDATVGNDELLDDW